MGDVPGIAARAGGQLLGSGVAERSVERFPCPDGVALGSARLAGFPSSPTRPMPRGSLHALSRERPGMSLAVAEEPSIRAQRVRGGSACFLRGSEVDL
jgi:hypothetical protein